MDKNWGKMVLLEEAGKTLSYDELSGNHSYAHKGKDGADNTAEHFFTDAVGYQRPESGGQQGGYAGDEGGIDINIAVKDITGGTGSGGNHHDKG